MWCGILSVFVVVVILNMLSLSCYASSLLSVIALVAVIAVIAMVAVRALVAVKMNTVLFCSVGLLAMGLMNS